VKTCCRSAFCPLDGGRFECRRYGFELHQRRSQVFDDLAGNDLRRWEVVHVFEGLVAQPRDVEIRLVPGDELVVSEGGPCLAALMSVLSAMVRSSDG